MPQISPLSWVMIPLFFFGFFMLMMVGFWWAMKKSFSFFFISSSDSVERVNSLYWKWEFLC
uniref:ATP synthase F0 subunit 8 n=1 Tax=Amphiporus formidabilis TaxID=187592 RepID=X2CBV0_9BILA|nr:ATP synthase F0 subunit 8 [Amphiporus formidabilis]AGL46759.1 ATP synthase F0 subunit 8 [Amphiporus formidabilis]